MGRRREWRRVVGLDGFALLCFALGFVGEGMRARVVMPMAVSMGILYFLFPLFFTLRFGEFFVYL